MQDSEKIQAQWPGWRVVRKLGQGGFGAVYEIERDVFGETEKAALKTISIPQNDDDIEELKAEGYDNATITKRYHSYLENIVKEYSTMAKLKGHPNVVYCDDLKYTQHDDGFGWDIFIRMELLTPILQCLDRIENEQSAIELGISIASALTACAKHNIIHRDIKPQNIFVSSDGIFKLGDFGIAKTVDHATSGTKIGTMRYIAPEVYHGRPYGAAADQYSLGLVLYWLLNERRIPFLPKLANASQEESARTRRLMGEQIPPPAHGSRELQAIVLKACAYDPAQRFSSAEEMMNALKSLQGGAVFTGTALNKGEAAAVASGSAPSAERSAHVDATVLFPGFGQNGNPPAEGGTVLFGPQSFQTPQPAPAVQPQQNPYPQPAPAVQPQQNPYPQPAPVSPAPQEPVRNGDPEKGEGKKKEIPILPIIIGGVILLAGIVFLLIHFLGGKNDTPPISPSSQTKEARESTAAPDTKAADTTSAVTKAETAAETDDEDTDEPADDEETAEEMTVGPESVVDNYSNMFICRPYNDNGRIDKLNVRSTPSEDGLIIARLYPYGGGEILDDDGTWLHVKTGGIEGYVQKELVFTGEEAKETAPDYAVISVQAAADIDLLDSVDSDADIYFTVEKGTVMEFIDDDDDGFYRVYVSGSTVGFVRREDVYKGYFLQEGVEYHYEDIPVTTCYADFMSAGLNTEVTIEAYVQVIQCWEKGAVTVYAQDKSGGYYIPDLACSEEDAEALRPGTKISVTGNKVNDQGEIQINDAVFSVVDDGTSYIAPAKDVTIYLGLDDIINFQNRYVEIEHLSVKKRGNGVYTYKLDDSGTEGDDLFFDAANGLGVYTFKVERRISDVTSELYTGVKKLKAGDVINIKGFPFCWENTLYFLVTEMEVIR